jgi:hypothetical protein
MRRFVVAALPLPKGTNSELLTEMLLGLMDGLLLEYSFLGKKTDPEKVADQILLVFGSQSRGE